MKIRPAVKVLAIFVLLIQAVFIRSLAAEEETKPPESVILDTLQELYEAVEFDHAMHMEISECRVCHHHTLGGASEDPLCSRCHANSGPARKVGCVACHGTKGDAESDEVGTPYHLDTPGLKGALHLLCVECHQGDGGPTACQACHAFTEKGRSVFFVHDSKQAGGQP